MKIRNHYKEIICGKTYDIIISIKGIYRSYYKVQIYFIKIMHFRRGGSI